MLDCDCCYKYFVRISVVIDRCLCHYCYFFRVCLNFYFILLLDFIISIINYNVNDISIVDNDDAKDHHY